MLVSEEARFLFVHVQKTAGTSVTRYLRKRFPDTRDNDLTRVGKHAPLQQILKAYPELGGLWTFGFVRNPWDRMHAWHAMIVRRRRMAEEGNDVIEDRIARNRVWRTVIEDYPTFEGFVLEGMDDERLPMLRRPQVDYLQSRTRIADFIGRQESFDTDFRAVCARLGIDPPAKELSWNRNPERSADYRDAYSPEMRDKVGKVFERDLLAFGYEF